ncbi:hypothetical protein KSP39_PZI022513 [Platanthera zijinensis]|uniref:Uncharacterized protein n=1 Tax=Platanthera zijinensis TaxID=2320716 RepID=A0AAP0FVB6_9ASPA
MRDLDGEQKQLIKTLVSFRMKDGKRTRARAFVSQTFHHPARTERDVIKLMVDVVDVGLAHTRFKWTGRIRSRKQVATQYLRLQPFLCCLESCPN